jgi:hypothetical protein
VLLLAALIVVATTVRVTDRWPAGASSHRTGPRRADVRQGQAVAGGGGQRSRFPAVAAGGVSVAAPLRIARRAATALWSFDWTHPASAAPASLTPWVTAGLRAELANAPGAPAATAALVGEHETVRVVSVTVTVASRSAAGVGVAVSAEVAVCAHGHSPVGGREDAEILVVPTPAGWRVASIDL